MIKFEGMRTGEASVDSDGNPSITDVYVYLATDSEQPVDILLMPELPAYGTPYPGYPAISRGNMSITKADGTEMKRTFEVSVTYDIQQDSGYDNNEDMDEQGNPIKPWHKPASNVTLAPVDTIQAFEKAYYYNDPDGHPNDENHKPTKPVVSSSGTPIAAQTVHTSIVLSFTYWGRGANTMTIYNFYNTINDRDMHIAGVFIPKYFGLLKKFQITKKKKINVETGVVDYTYDEIQVEIEIKYRAGDSFRELADKSTYTLRPVDPNDASKGTQPVRIWYNDKAKGGIGGFGTKDELVKAGAKAEDLAPSDIELPLKDDGTISITDGKFDVKYLSFIEHYIKDWTGLYFPEF